MKDWKGNTNSIYKTLGASNHTEEDREENDYYATDPIAIDKLIDVEQLNCTIWECACGENHLADRLRSRGFQVFASDIVKRKKDINQVQDFLKVGGVNSCCRDIVTNPPYKYAKEFVLKALEILAPGYKACMFLKLTFLEGKTRFKEIFKNNPPKVVYVFSERILCAKNAEFEKMKAGGGSAVAYAWFVWEKGWNGKTTIEWI